MVRVFAADLTAWMERGMPEEAAAILSAERRERWERRKGSLGVLQSSAAELLLRRALRECGTPTPAEWIWEYEEGGKPSLRGLTDLCFNLSHSGRYAACVLAEGPAGVDVQTVPGPNRLTAARRFRREETTEVERAENPEEVFCGIWTAKEAYLKMRGTGLRRPLDSFCIAPDGRVEDPPGQETDCRVTWLTVWPGRRDAVLAVCARERCAETVTFWQAEELLPEIG